MTTANYLQNTVLRPVKPPRAIYRRKTITTVDALKSEIESDYSACHNWQKVADKWRVSVGMAHRVAHGYEPKDDEIRAALGLPPLADIQVPVIAQCACGQWYAPNTAKRRRCYTCEGIRRRK